MENATDIPQIPASHCYYQMTAKAFLLLSSIPTHKRSMRLACDI